MKRTPLNRDPVKLREWQRRAAIKAQRRVQDRTEANQRAYDRPAITSSERPVAGVGKHPSKQKVPPQIPANVRQAARARSDGKCVVCVYDGRRRGKAVHLHHVLEKQHYPRLIADSANLIGVCADCHANHHAASRRIPWEALPDVTVRLIAQQGPAVLDYVARRYPRTSTDEEQAA